MILGTWELTVAYDVLAAAVDLGLTDQPKGMVDHRIQAETPGSMRFQLSQPTLAGELGELGMVRVLKLSEGRSELRIEVPSFCHKAVTAYMREQLIPALFFRLNQARIWPEADQSETQATAGEVPSGPPITLRRGDPDVLKRRMRVKDLLAQGLTQLEITQKIGTVGVDSIKADVRWLRRHGHIKKG